MAVVSWRISQSIILLTTLRMAKLHQTTFNILSSQSHKTLYKHSNSKTADTTLIRQVKCMKKNHLCADGFSISSNWNVKKKILKKNLKNQYFRDKKPS